MRHITHTLPIVHTEVSVCNTDNYEVSVKEFRFPLTRYSAIEKKIKSLLQPNDVLVDILYTDIEKHTYTQTVEEFIEHGKEKGQNHV